MPVYDAITYSDHATRRMRQRRISPEDVELVLRVGDGSPEDDGTWRVELDRLAVVVVIEEREDVAHVVTVMRMRRHT